MIANYYEIKLSNKCYISYSPEITKIKSYHCVYEGNLKYYYDIDIYFNSEQDSFIVKCFGENDVAFESIKKAEEYVFERINSFKKELDKENK